MNPARGGWVILLTLVLAMLLSVMHLPAAMPDWLIWLRPNWLVLVLFYWVMALPHRLGLIAAWMIGLFADVLHGELLGVNALALACITYITWSFYERLRMYTGAQQALVLLLLTALAELFRLLIQMLTLGAPFTLGFLLTALITMLCWLPAYAGLGWLRRQFAVH